MSAAKPPSIQRGQVWNVEFDPQVVSEIRKIRPAVVMSLPTVGRPSLHIVVPITTGRPVATSFWMLPIAATSRNGLDHDSFADGSQVKSVSAERIRKYRGTLSQQELDELAAIIAFCVGYRSPKPPPGSS
ncbi:MAG: type II toxin-antitoxin system PemK/MazF family toxin [Chloroflexi bacterium]|nr:type II toxin-antitoxin system PemK/MazF family toxin [Chloroflexota bacterium]